MWELLFLLGLLGPKLFSFLGNRIIASYFFITIYTCCLWKEYFVIFHEWIITAWMSLFVSYPLYVTLNTKPSSDDDDLFYVTYAIISLIFLIIHWFKFMGLWDITEWWGIDDWVWNFVLKDAYYVESMLITLVNIIKTSYWVLSIDIETETLTLYCQRTIDYKPFWYINVVLENNYFLGETKLQTKTVDINTIKDFYMSS